MNTIHIMKKHWRNILTSPQKFGHYFADNGCCPRENIRNLFKCGIPNGNLRKWIHYSDELRRLGQKKEDFFSGSNPHCSGNFQDHYDLVGVLRWVDICALPCITLYWKNVKIVFDYLGSDQSL